MAASYPGSIVTLASHSDGDTVFAADINTPNAEIVAVETGLLNGFQHDLIPLADDTRSLGSTSKRWLKGWFQDIDCDGTFTLNGVGTTVLAAPVNTLCAGRLTLTSGLPVTTADVTAATTVYWTPTTGKYVGLYDGVSAWTTLAFAELSIVVPATTSQMYDVFVYNNSGVVALELLAWTNDTTRATALVLQDGVLVKTGATTRRYVGSFRTTTVSGQTEDSYAKRYVWNYYNRVRRISRVFEATDSWNYTTATWRQANAAAGNQLDFVIGVAEVGLHAQALSVSSNTSAGARMQTAIGEDSTTTPSATHLYGAGDAATAGLRMQNAATLDTYPAVGRHFYAWLEYSAALGTTTWFGDNGANSSIQTGIEGWIEG